MNFSWNIKVKGFGPFAVQAGGVLDLKKSRVAIYSGNGQGKTCISRMFRAAEPGAVSLPDGILTRGGSSGTFSFKVKRSGQQDKELRVSKKHGQDAVIDNGTGYLFHVFNSDYIKQNLAQVHYSPRDDITGFIVGKENIDVSDKRAKLEELRKRGTEKRQAIERAVSAVRTVLTEHGMTRIKEFNDFTTDNVLHLSADATSFDEKLDEFDALRRLPEAAPRLEGLTFNSVQIDLDAIITILTTVYSRDQFAEEFLADVQIKREFITTGLGLVKNDTCPFCKRRFNDDAHELIKHYEEYVAGQEAQTISLIEGYIRQLGSLKRSYSDFLASYQSKRSVFSQHKDAFSTLAETTLPDMPSLNDLDEVTKPVNNLLAKKIEDISATYATNDVDALRIMLDNISTNIVRISEAFATFDQLYQSASKTLTAVKRDLCSEAGKKVRIECSDIISDRDALLVQFRTLSDEIRDAEAKGRRSKRDAVADMFAKTLHSVFGNKYAFDQERFAIIFDKAKLSEDADQILSDGEKSALAFCHYVASTLTLLESDADAENLFFVIDDPISSLDYHYVYSVAQMIRDLARIFDTKRHRILVLTHNSAFFNMLARNGITAEHFILSNGIIDKCTDSGIAPYSEHLRDIYAVCGGEKPRHTTGNSIRQIIETLWRFDNPAAHNLLSYLGTDECQDLAQCEYIYTLCQDQSHGASVFDRQQPADEQSVRRACWTLLEHIHNRYPGQLTATGIAFDNKAVVQETADQEQLLIL